MESGRDTNLPAMYKANSPAIAQHNANEWNNRSRTSAMRLSELLIPGVNSLNHVAFPATVCDVSCASVALADQLKYRAWWDAMNLKNVKVIITKIKYILLITIIFSSHTRPINSCDRKTNSVKVTSCATT